MQALTTREGIGRDRFEFQMLYGVRPALQQRIDELRSAPCLISGPQREPEAKGARALYHKINRDQST